MAGPSSARSNHATRVGLVSDTHGLLRRELMDAFAGVEAILHAGDVGSREVLDELRRIAPVHAVTGNVDTVVPGLDLPAFARYVVNGTGMLVTHYIGAPDGLLAPVAGELARVPAQVVISGHTHRPELCVSGARLFVNPGSAGAQRGAAPASCGLLTLHPRGAGARIVARILDPVGGGMLSEETLTVGRR